MILDLSHVNSSSSESKLGLDWKHVWNFTTGESETEFLSWNRISWDDAGEYLAHHELETNIVSSLSLLLLSSSSSSLLIVVVIIIINNNDIVIMMQGSPLTSPSTYTARHATCLGGKGGWLMFPWTTLPSASSMLSCSTGGPHVTAYNNNKCGRIGHLSKWAMWLSAPLWVCVCVCVCVIVASLDHLMYGCSVVCLNAWHDWWMCCYRHTDKAGADGMMHSGVRPYLMDLGSANGTYLNNDRIEAERYYELLEKVCPRHAMHTFIVRIAKHHCLVREGVS